MDFNFRGPDVERLVKGRERIDLLLILGPTRLPIAKRSTRRPAGTTLGCTRGLAQCDSAFNQFEAFTQDATDNKVFFAKGKLTMPILALGGDYSFGTQMADIMCLVATNVTAAS